MKRQPRKPDWTITVPTRKEAERMMQQVQRELRAHLKQLDRLRPREPGTF